MNLHPFVTIWRSTCIPGEPAMLLIDGALTPATIAAPQAHGLIHVTQFLDGVMLTRAIAAGKVFPSLRGSAKTVAMCPASRRLMLTSNVIDADTPATLEGSAAHKIAEKTSTTADVPLTEAEAVAIATEFRLSVGDVRRMEAMIRSYRERVADLEVALGWETRREHRMAALLPCGVALSGQADVLAISDSGTEAAIEDYKTGWGAVEPAVNNWQALVYACLVFGNFPDIRRVSFRFAFTRALGNDAPGVAFDRGDFEAVILPAIQQRAIAAFSPRADFSIGAHCKNCRVRGVCPVLRDEVHALPAPTLPRAIADLTPEERGAAAAKLFAVEGWVAQVRDAFEEFLKTSGEEIALPDGRFWRLVEGAPRRSYDLSVLSDARECNLGEATADENGVPWGEFLRVRGEAIERDLLEALKAAERRKLGVTRLPKGVGDRLAESLRTTAQSIGALTEQPNRALRVVPSSASNPTTAPAALPAE